MIDESIHCAEKDTCKDEWLCKELAYKKCSSVWRFQLFYVYLDRLESKE